MWKKRYIIAVGLSLLLTSWFLSQALYPRIAVWQTASPDTKAKPAPALAESRNMDESQAITHPPVDVPSQKTTPLQAKKTTADAAAARVKPAQTLAGPALKDTLTVAATCRPAQEPISQADRSVGSEFPASVKKTTIANATAVADIVQEVDSTKIATVQFRTPPCATVVEQPFAQVEAETLASSLQPSDSSAIAELLSQALAEEAAEPQRQAEETPEKVEAEPIVLFAQPSDSSMIADDRTQVPLSAVLVQQPSKQTTVSAEKAGAVVPPALPEETTVAAKASGKKQLSVNTQNRADVDEEKVYEDILNLIKSKMALNQSSPAAHSEPAIVLASREPATTEPVPGLRPVQQTRPARHGIGLAIGTAQPNMAERVRMPVFAELHYRYQSTRRTQLQVVAGGAPLLWPGGRQTLQLSADLIGRYGLFLHPRVQPNLSFGLGALSTGMQSGPSLASGTLLAGAGVNLSLAQQWSLGVQVQYKYCLQNPASKSSMRRDGYLQIKTELTYNLRQSSSIRLQSEENYLAEKQ